MGKTNFRNKNMIFPERLHSTACSITHTNKSINNYKVLKDSMFTSFKLVNLSLKLEKNPNTQQKSPVNYS